MNELSPLQVKHSTGRRTMFRMNREFFNTFGKRINILRRERGWTQDDLAERLSRHGVTVGKTWISTLERSKTNKLPATDVVVTMAKVLGTTTDYLLMVTDDPALSGNHEPVYFSPQADEAARLIDSLTDDVWRGYCVVAVREVLEEYAERQKALIALNRQIERLRSHGATELVAQIERELATLASPADRQAARTRLETIVRLFGTGG